MGNALIFTHSFIPGQGYAKYWLLEVHYNNPDLVEGVNVSTGFEVGRDP